MTWATAALYFYKTGYELLRACKQEYLRPRNLLGKTAFLHYDRGDPGFSVDGSVRELHLHLQICSMFPPIVTTVHLTVDMA